jgi:periplasmic iron binding protein
MLSHRFLAGLAVAALSCGLVCGPAFADTIGEPLQREGLEISAHAETGGTLDHTPGGMARGTDVLFLVADVRAGKDEPHGFSEHSFIPYLSISYALSKDGAPTYKQAGLLYPAASKTGPHYAAGAQLSGPGTYHLTYIISPPSTHGMMRQTDKASAVPEWWKPISANWTFTYPLNPPLASK